jgi:secreted PhoX family phosphatase
LAHFGIETRQRLWAIGNARQAHGYVFEVGPAGVDDPRPILGMGQFWHEAATVDPQTGFVYMTEDRGPHAGFYRYIPEIPGNLHAGGKLQMLRVEGLSELTKGIGLFSPAPVDWVDIDEPGRGHTPGTHDGKGVVSQGLEAGGSAFRALEGCVWHDSQLYFTSKNSGAKRGGYVFQLDLRQSSLQLIYESPGRGGFSGPDNVNVSPRGNLVICEDREAGSTRGQHLAGLNPAGELFAFCRINPEISGNYAGHNLANTAAKSEWAGVCFSPDGQWMFANIYGPGLSCAITGPWVDGFI